MSSTDIISLTNNFNNAITSIYKYVILVIYICGNIGNLLSFLIFLKKSWKKNVCVFYFQFCLLFNTCYLNTTTLGAIVINGFGINLENSNIILCKLYFYTSFLFATLSPTILILASIDRLLISSQNVDTRLYSSKRLAYFSVGISICFWIVFNIHLLVYVNIQRPYPFYSFCFYDLSTFYLNFVTYSTTVIHLIFFLLMIILCLVAFKNVRRIRSVPRQKRAQQIRAMNKKDFQLLRCLFAHDIIFIIFGMLIILYYVYYNIRKDQIQSQLEQVISNFLNKFFSCLYSIAFSSNFFVFIILSKAFRHELKRGIYKVVGKEFNPTREDDNTTQNNKEINVVSTIVLHS